MIYFDNAATTMPKPKAVIDAIVYALSHFGNANRGAHGETLEASLGIFQTRQKLAKFFGADRAQNVVFTANSTDSLNIVLNGLLNPGDRVVTTVTEHNSVLRPLYRLEKERQLALAFVGVDQKGNLLWEEMEEALRRGGKLLVCSHASNLTGNLLDLKRLSGLCHDRGMLLVVDASQTAGCIPISMRELGIDVLCFTGHKGLMGPQGTGGIVIQGDLPIRPYRVGGTGVQSFSKTQPQEMPTRLEAGTLNGHGIAGLSAALDVVSEMGIDKIHEKEMGLMKRFLEGVRRIPGVTLYGDYDHDRVAIVTLNLGDQDSALVSDLLEQNYGIATRPGAHCAPLMHRALGTEKQGAVRFSFSWRNTPEEIDRGIQALREIATEI